MVLWTVCSFCTRFGIIGCSTTLSQGGESSKWHIVIQVLVLRKAPHADIDMRDCDGDKAQLRSSKTLQWV